MSERFKYATNGVYKCENFAQHLATGRFPSFRIGYAPHVTNLQVYNKNPEYISTFSYLTFKVQEEYNQVYPYVDFAEKQKLKIRVLLNIKSKYWSLSYQTNGSIYMELEAGVSGPSISIQDVLNEENGYLENGALCVEYGIHVDAVQFLGVWEFIFSKKMFDNKEEHKKIICDFGNLGPPVRGVLYCPKQLLLFHSTLCSQETENETLDLFNYDRRYVQDCLQIAHGVRIKDYSWFYYALIAQFMGIRNVVQYCDYMHVRMYYSKILMYKYDLKYAIKLNMRHSASRMIEQEDFEELLKELKGCLDEIPGEMMKVIIRKFINEEI